ncbi:hypothetical protein QJQ58_27455 [Paenibacillus dendritiformis]|uniref:hypothetical protein n=1 Tax=Paenibacillus TaxID=44249 RepID=UPI001059E64F|nr:hypothetical protein [Paenibacillus dendritiformis]TDL57973.1 hypothetical protein E2R60_05770 [Paenibacillus dendritiformis]WGU94192.1 hypothetical protein QJQ58_27455 [Paenibacillus dendritiformis]
MSNMHTAGSVAFITIYIFMGITIFRSLFKLKAKSECDDEASILECDKQVIHLLTMFMVWGVSLIFIIWFVLHFSFPK